MGSSTSGIVRFSPARYAPSPIAAMRSKRCRAAVRRDIARLVAAESDRVGHLFARLATLGPARHPGARIRGGAGGGRRGGAVLRSVSNAPAGTRLRIRVADGALNAISSGPTEGEI